MKLSTLLLTTLLYPLHSFANGDLQSCYHECEDMAYSCDATGTSSQCNTQLGTCNDDCYDEYGDCYDPLGIGSCDSVYH